MLKRSTGKFGVGGVRLVRRHDHLWEFDFQSEIQQRRRLLETIGTQEEDWLERACLYSTGTSMTGQPLVLQDCDVDPECRLLSFMRRIPSPEHGRLCVYCVYTYQDEAKLVRLAAYVVNELPEHRGMYEYFIPLTVNGSSENEIEAINEVHCEELEDRYVLSMEESPARLTPPKIHWKGRSLTATGWIEKMTDATGATPRAVQRVLSSTGFDMDRARPRLLHLRNSVARCRSEPAGNVVYLHAGASFDRNQFAAYLSRRYCVSESAASERLSFSSTVEDVTTWASKFGSRSRKTVTS